MISRLQHYLFRFVLLSLPVSGSYAADVNLLFDQQLQDIPGKSGQMLTVTYGPGESSAQHRHNAHTFVYVLEGSVVMGVKGSDPVTLGAGETFYENPDDIHNVSRNASDTEPAKILVFFIKGTNAPPTVPVE